MLPIAITLFWPYKRSEIHLSGSCDIPYRTINMLPSFNVWWIVYVKEIRSLLSDKNTFRSLLESLRIRRPRSHIEQHLEPFSKKLLFPISIYISVRMWWYSLPNRHFWITYLLYPLWLHMKDAPWIEVPCSIVIQRINYEHESLKDSWRTVRLYV